jgi:dTDP-4-dehydrorhamnose 3,5-epimerase
MSTVQYGGGGIMKVVDQLLGGVLVVGIPRFHDNRGTFTVAYQVEAAGKAGLPTNFVQDNHSLSLSAGTLRGLHLQTAPWGQGKLVRVLAGRILDVFVDLRLDSPTQGQYGSLELSPVDDFQLWIPPGFAHGFCTLESSSEVFYKVDAPYRPEAEVTLAWDDPDVGIVWPFSADELVLSAKDAEGQDLDEVMRAVKSALGGEG